VDLPNSEIYFSIFSFTKTLYIFKFGEARSKAISTDHLAASPPNLKKNFNGKKLLLLSFPFYFLLFKYFLNISSLVGPRLSRRNRRLGYGLAELEKNSNKKTNNSFYFLFS
jgi:hypothetical protein